MEDIAYLVIRNHALAADTLPRELTFMRYGDNPTDRGVFRVTERTVAAIKAQREAGLKDRVVVDFEHNSLPGSPTYKEPPRDHAGAGLVACSVDKGLGLEDCQWSPAGRRFAPGYPDISPVVKYDKETMEVVGLESAGLVPNGGVIGLSFFSVLPDESGSTHTQEKEAMEELKAQIAQLLEQVTSLVERVKALEGASNPAPEAVEAMSAKVTTLEGKVEQFSTDMKTELARRDKDAILTQAAFAGKVVQLTGEAIAALSIEDLRAHVDQLPVTVPLHRRTPLGQKPAEGTGESLIAQFNAIEDPVKRAEFYREHRAKLVG